MRISLHRAIPTLFLLIAAITVHGAEPLKEPGAMLREGTWSDGVGSYFVPHAFETLNSAKWPTGGWSKMTIGADHIHSAMVAAPKGKMPDFLRSIISQREDSNSASSQASSAGDAQEWKNEIYLRVSGVRLLEGKIPVYMFKNGTRELRPQLDNKYELLLGTRPFSVTVRNGMRGKNGQAYGDGAHYTIEYGGHKYYYRLGQFGWDSSITAIADLDGDGKPDFIINVGVSNGGYEAVLLSSKAKPGMNPATASLSQGGC